MSVPGGKEGEGGGIGQLVLMLGLSSQQETLGEEACVSSIPFPPSIHILTHWVGKRSPQTEWKQASNSQTFLHVQRPFDIFAKRPRAFLREMGDPVGTWPLEKLSRIEGFGGNQFLQTQNEKKASRFHHSRSCRGLYSPVLQKRLTDLLLVLSPAWPGSAHGC